MHEFSRIGLIVRMNDLRVADTLHEAYDHLIQQNYDVLLDHSTRGVISGPATVDIQTIGKECDLALVIGGDGTLLHAARELVDYRVPIVGINRGRLGFLVDVSPEHQLAELDAILAGKHIDEERFLLDVSVTRGSDVLFESYAFNDVVLRVREMLRIMEFETYIDSNLINTQRADGVIISSPSGSTAYSLSNGGPIVTPSLEAIVLHPICPHTLSSRPIVIPSSSTIEIRISDKNIDSGQLVADGQVYFDVTTDDLITIKRKATGIRLLHPEHYNYFEILRSKLNWN